MQFSVYIQKQFEMCLNCENLLKYFHFVFVACFSVKLAALCACVFRLSWFVWNTMTESAGEALKVDWWKTAKRVGILVFLFKPWPLAPTNPRRGWEPDLNWIALPMCLGKFQWVEDVSRMDSFAGTKSTQMAIETWKTSNVLMKWMTPNMGFHRLFYGWISFNVYR